MGEKSVCGERVTAAAVNARDWANQLISRESRGPGDTENAMHRLETRYGVPWRVFWSLRYRPPPQDLLTGVYERLRAAYMAECERQMRLLRHEIELTKAKAGPDAPAVVTAATLVDEDDEDIGG